MLETNQFSLVGKHPSENISQKLHILCKHDVFYASTMKLSVFEYMLLVFRYILRAQNCITPARHNAGHNAVGA